MKRFVAVIVPALAMALGGCGAEDGALDEVENDEEANAAEAAAWVEIAPGVWERPRVDGAFERMGIGADGLSFALEAARRERVDAGSAKASDAHMKYMEASLSEARAAESELRPKDLDDAPAPPSPGATPTGPSGALCGGYYAFDITLIPGMAGGGVTTTAEWTEFGPFSGLSQKLMTYSYAAMGDGTGIFEENWSTTGLFANQCCVMTDSYANAGPTFTPQLLGRGYVKGCGQFLYYEVANF